MSDFYEKRAADFEQRWHDEIAAGKLVREQRDELLRQTRHTSIPQSYWVIKNEDGEYSTGYTLYRSWSKKLLDAERHGFNPIAPEGCRVMRICVYEEEA